MLSLPPSVISAKNAMYQADGFAELMEIQMSEAGQTLRIANWNTDIMWGGYTWSKSYFDNGDQEDSGGNVNDTVTVRVSNVDRIVQGELEDSVNALIGDIVIYRQIYTGDLTSLAALTAQFDIIDAVATPVWVIFELGVENFYLFQFPAHVFRRDLCRYGPTLTSVCPYVNNDSCDRSFASCVFLGQQSVFGGQPAIPGGAFNLPAAEIDHGFMDTGGTDMEDTSGEQIEDTGG